MELSLETKFPVKALPIIVIPSPEMIQSKYMYEKATYNAIEAQTIHIKDEDLSQVIQSLMDKIQVLSDRIKALEPPVLPN